MASVFEQIDSVLLVSEPRRPKGVRPHNLLWPVWCRRVATPIDQGDEIGPFERAVLNCARARQTDAEHVATLLCLDRRFVELIRDNLRSNGVLHADYRISERGLEALESGTIGTSAIQSVYSFTCAMSGQLLPRFSEQLNYAITRSSQGRIHLEDQSDAEAREFPCFRLVPSDSTMPPIPQATELLRASERHLEERRNAILRLRGEGDEDTGASLHRAIPLERVHVIDEIPQPMFLATIAYQDTERAGSDEGLVVEDPFGFGPSRRFREQLRIARPKSKELTVWLSKVTQLDSNQSKLQNDSTLYWSACETEVERNLERRVIPTELMTDLTAVEFHLLMSKDKNIEARQSGRHSSWAAQSCRNVLEGAFLLLAERYPISAIRTRVEQMKSNDMSFVQGRIQRACDAIGFDPQIPDRLWKIRPDNLKAVVLYNHYSKLAPFIVASLIVADRHPEHPFFALAKKEPRFLHDLATALSIAGEAAHFQSTQRRPDAELERLRNLSYQCVCIAADAQTAQHPSRQEKK